MESFGQAALWITLVVFFIKINPLLCNYTYTYSSYNGRGAILLSPLRTYFMHERCGEILDVASVGYQSSGLLKLMKYDSPYPVGMNCTVTLRVKPPYMIAASFTLIDIRSDKLSWNACPDYVQIFDGENSLAVSSRICGDASYGSDKQLVFTSPTQSMKIFFFSSIKGENPDREGFYLTFTAFSLSQNRSCSHPEEFLCDNGVCISKLLTCNGQNNCGDVSDEGKICRESNFERKKSVKWGPAGYISLMFAILMFLIILLFLLLPTPNRPQGILLSLCRKVRNEPSSTVNESRESIRPESDCPANPGYCNVAYVSDLPPSYEEATQVPKYPGTVSETTR